MDMSSIFNFSAATGPPARKGDSASGTRSLVEGMKTGLKAQYAKRGEKHQFTEAPKITADPYAENHVERRTAEVGPDAVKDALKTGLRAWYTKKGVSLGESTQTPNVGARLPERALGGWNDGRPSHRSATPMEKGGSSLRADIQRLERALEGTLATLSQNRRLSEKEYSEFGNLLVDAVIDMLRGDASAMRDVKMKATLIESRFIGDPVPETSQPLSHSNDLGSLFSSKMGVTHQGPIVEMVANQLSSGMPLRVIRSNVAAAMQTHTNSKIRGTLSKAARVLSEL